MKRLLIITFTLSITLFLTGCKSSEYKDAQKMASNGEYSEAVTAFTALGDYKDSEERAEILKIAQYKKSFLEAIDNLPELTIASYSAGTNNLKSISTEIVDFADDFKSSTFANDEELAETVRKLGVMGDGVLELLALDEESVEKFLSPGFYMFPSTMQMSIDNSVAILHSWTQQIQKIELPSKYDGWY